MITACLIGEVPPFPEEGVGFLLVERGVVFAMMIQRDGGATSTRLVPGVQPACAMVARFKAPEVAPLSWSVEH